MPPSTGAVQKNTIARYCVPRDASQGSTDPIETASDFDFKPDWAARCFCHVEDKKCSKHGGKKCSAEVYEALEKEFLMWREPAEPQKVPFDALAKFPFALFEKYGMHWASDEWYGRIANPAETQPPSEVSQSF